MFKFRGHARRERLPMYWGRGRPARRRRRGTERAEEVVGRRLPLPERFVLAQRVLDQLGRGMGIERRRRAPFRRSVFADDFHDAEVGAPVSRRERPRLAEVDAHDSPREAADGEFRFGQVALCHATVEVPQTTGEEGLALVAVHVA